LSMLRRSIPLSPIKVQLSHAEEQRCDARAIVL